VHQALVNNFLIIRFVNKILTNARGRKKKKRGSNDPLIDLKLVGV